MTLDEVRTKRLEILNIARRYDVSNLRVFGSVARGEARPESDVDLMFDPGPDLDGLDLMELWEAIEQVLDTKIDLVPARSLLASVRETALKDAVAL